MLSETEKVNIVLTQVNKMCSMIALLVFYVGIWRSLR